MKDEREAPTAFPSSFRLHPLSLTPARHDVEHDFEAVAYAYGGVEGGGGGHFEVAALYLELAARAQRLAFERDLGGDLDAARDSAERQVAAELDLEDAAARLGRDIRALEGYLGVLVRLKDYVAQLAVDNLLLLSREHVARLGERRGAHGESERGGVY